MQLVFGTKLPQALFNWLTWPIIIKVLSKDSVTFSAGDRKDEPIELYQTKDFQAQVMCTSNLKIIIKISIWIYQFEKNQETQQKYFNPL